MDKDQLHQLFISEVLHYLPLEEVLSDHNPKDKNRYINIVCPDCKGIDFVYKNTGAVRCNSKNNCGYKGNIFSLLNNGTQPTGQEYIEIMKKLFATAGKEFPKSEYMPTPEEIAKNAKKDRQKQQWSDFHDITIENLKASADGLNYLKNRGVDNTIIDKHELGCYSNASHIKKELENLGYSPEEINNSGVVREDWNHRIVIPIKDLRHNITNFAARDITGKSESKVLYMSSLSGATLDFPFNLNNVDGDHVIAVEGIFDALALIALGLKNIVALGGTSVTEGHIRTFKKANIKSVTVFLDNDNAGRDGSLNAIHKLANAGIDSYIVPSSKLGDAKDPDEYINKFKGTTIEDIIKARENGLRYIVRDIANRCNKSGNWDDFELAEAFEEAKKFIDSINLAQDVSLTIFTREFEKLTGIDESTIDSCIQITQEQQAKKEIEAAKLKTIKENSYLVKLAFETSDITNIRKALSDAENSFTSFDHLCKPKPIKTADILLEPHDKMLAERWKNKYIGLCQKTLPMLDDRLLGLRGLIILAAAPNVGKTALATQLALDVIKNNPEVGAIFVTLEMPTDEILSRIRCNLADLEWRKLMSGDFTEDELKALNASSALLREFGSRIEFIDSSLYAALTFEDLKLKINEHKKRTGCKRMIVIIDYLQVWPVPDEIRQKYHGENELEKWRVDQMKFLRDFLNQEKDPTDPLIVISEARKPSSRGMPWAGDLSDVMGAARTTYGPDVVFLYWPVADSELEAAWTNITDEQFEVIMGIQKDKNNNLGVQIREYYARQNESIVCLTISKSRSGTKKGQILLKYNFEKNKYGELYWPTEIQSLQSIYYRIINEKKYKTPQSKELPEPQFN